jgi:hypothetical protein
VEHEPAAHLAHAMLALEPVNHVLELLRIGTGDLQQVVVITGQAGGGDHLLDRRQPALELAAVDPLAQPHVAHQLEPAPQRRQVEPRVVAADDA